MFLKRRVDMAELRHVATRVRVCAWHVDARVHDVCDTCTRLCVTRVHVRVCTCVFARVREILLNGLVHSFRI